MNDRISGSEPLQNKETHWYYTGAAKFIGILLCALSGILLAASLFGILVVIENDLFSLDAAEIESAGFDTVGHNYAFAILENCTQNDPELQQALGDPAVIIRTEVSPEGTVGFSDGGTGTGGSGEDTLTEVPADSTSSEVSARSGDVEDTYVILDISADDADAGLDPIEVSDGDSESDLSAVYMQSSTLDALASYDESALEFGVMRFSIPLTRETRYYNITPGADELDLSADALFLYRTEGFVPNGSDHIIYVPEGTSFSYTLRSAAGMLLRNSYVSYDPSDYAEYYEGEEGSPRTWYGIVYRVNTAAADRASELTASSSIGAQMNAVFVEMDTLMGLAAGYVRWCVLLLAAAIAVFLASYVLCLTSAGHRRGSEEVRRHWVDSVPLALIVAAAAGAAGTMMAAGYSMSTQLFGYRMQSTNMNLVFLAQILALLAFLCMMVGIGTSMTIAVRIKTHTFWRTTLLYWILRPVAWLWRKFCSGIRGIHRAFRALGSMMSANVSLTVRVVLILAGVTILELIGIAATAYDADGEIFLLFLAKCISVPLILWGVIQFERIRSGARRIAGGQLDNPISTHRMYPGFRDVASDINRSGEGIRNAVMEQTKSERMKTELITNVSHDIKTPLTSIINYVDLMQKEPTDNPKIAEYLAVLDRQSAKLKKLIEDLLEASKAATGNIEMNIAPCDLNLVLSQAMGEFEDRLSAADLTPVVSGPEHVMIQADPRYLWRVFDNLLSNVCKYALPGTRLYIDVKELYDGVQVTFKNISRSPLNISGEELMERFVQGDRSRNTEGSGLGLSISNSLVSLMGGKMRVDCDGDLYKATVLFEKV